MKVRRLSPKRQSPRLGRPGGFARGGAPALLLDAHTFDLACCISHQIKTGQTRPFRYRDAGDDAEYNAQFSDGLLDQSDITTNIGSDTARIVLLDNPEGDNPAQSTAANQPRIALNGTIVTVNGVPAMQLVSAVPYFLVSTLLPGSTGSIFFFGQDTGSASQFSASIGAREAADDDRSYLGVFGDPRQEAIGVDDEFWLSGSELSGQNLLSGFYGATYAEVYRNGAQTIDETPTAAPDNATQVIYVGAENHSGTANAEMDGEIHLVAWRNADLRSDRAAIESIINGMYA